MAKVPLTDISIRALKPPESGQQTHWDKNLGGFGVRVSRGGTKSFVLVHGANRQRTEPDFAPLYDQHKNHIEACRAV